MWLNSIKRRFSSTQVLNTTDSAPEQSSSQQTIEPQQQQQHRSGLGLNMSSGQTGRKNPSPSAPSSPTKTMSLSAMMSAAKDIISNTTTAATSTVASSATGLFSTSPNSQQQQQRGSTSTGASKRKILLIIDDAPVDWSKFFRSKRVGEWELRIEQVSFSSKFLNITTVTNRNNDVKLYSPVINSDYKTKQNKKAFYNNFFIHQLINQSF